MSDSSNTPARPVSLLTILFLLAIFASFLLVIRWFYHPVTTPAFVGTAENLSKDAEWRGSRDSRRKVLQEIRATEAKKASGYAWVDQSAGVVQLPIERAMELTVESYRAKK